MIADLEPYPALKDSGLLWLGRVPEHWEVRRLKTVFREIDRRSGTGEEPLLSLRMQQGLVDHHEMGGKPISPSSLTHFKRTVPGEIVMNRMRAAAGLFAATPKVGLVSPDYAILRPRTAVALDYFVYLFQTPHMMSMFRTESRGLGTGESGFLRLYTERFGMLGVPAPTQVEQTAIVRFLDHVGRRVRRFVRAKQKLIGLLEEQKQAITHRAVTRGLDPDVPLKPSGVEWLGEVPEHWEVRRLKSLVRRIDQGVSPQAENYLADDGTWGVLKAGCVNHGVFREREHKRLPASFSYDRSLAVVKGDVLVSRASGSPHLVGSVGRVSSLKYKLILSDKTFRPVFKDNVDPSFAVLAMNSRYYRQQVEQAISGAEGLANNLPLSSLRAFSFVVPPAEEQPNIIAYVRESTEELLAAAGRAEREIDLLREFHTRLIADVVTGKLDVRAASASLPEQPDEPEPPDEADDPMNSDEEIADDLDWIPEEAEA